jgi:hypothetical protein
MSKKSKAVAVVEGSDVESNEPKALANINGQYVFAETPISWLIDKNPKRPSGRAHARFESYMKATTVQEYLDTGGTMADLKYDQARGFLSFDA